MNYLEITSKACKKEIPCYLNRFTDDVLSNREKLEFQLYDILVHCDDVLVNPYGVNAAREDVTENIDDAKKSAKYCVRYDDFDWDNLSDMDYIEIDTMARAYNLDDAISLALDDLLQAN